MALNKLSAILHIPGWRKRFRRSIKLMNLGAPIVKLCVAEICGEIQRAGLERQNIVFVLASGSAFTYKYSQKYDTYTLFPLCGKPGLNGYQLRWFPTKVLWEQ